MDIEELGAFIKEARKKSGLSQQELQEISGMNRVRISRLESGDLEEVGWSKVISLLSALGIDVSFRPAGTPPQLDEIIEEPEHIPPPSLY